MKIVQFIRNAPPYITGELAGFPDDHALRLVREGVVKLHEKEGEDPAGDGGSGEGSPGGETGEGQCRPGAEGQGVGGSTGDPAGDGGSGEGGGDVDPKAAAAAELLAQIDALAWKTFAVKAAELIGPGAPARKPEILAALRALAGQPQGQG